MSADLPRPSHKRKLGLGLVAGVATVGLAATLLGLFGRSSNPGSAAPPSHDPEPPETAHAMQATDAHAAPPAHAGSPQEGGMHHGDRAPGQERAQREDVGASVRGYLIGLGLAALLTAGSFLISTTNVIWGPSVPAALIVFAIAQMGVHLVFFLHLTTAPDNINNAMALAFGVLIVLLLIGGSVWIMYHMNQTMMPAGQMGTMNMQ